MRLPSVEECSKDQFLFTLRAEDERGFLATTKKMAIRPSLLDAVSIIRTN